MTFSFKRVKKFYKQPFNWLFTVLIVLNVLPILAPIFMYWGWEWAAKPIYFVYSFTCHQFAHRSMHIHDHQCAWCSRDMAIWGSMLFVAILVKRFNLQKSLSWYWLLPFTIPIALDGGIQTIATMLQINPVAGTGEAMYISSNLSRFLTGSIFGTGLGLWTLPALNSGFETVKSQANAFASKLRMTHLAVITVTSMFAINVMFVGVWGLTSPNYPPANIVDFAVRTPPADEFFLRREHAVCPADAAADPLALECFFSD